MAVLAGGVRAQDVQPDVQLAQADLQRHTASHDGGPTVNIVFDEMGSERVVKGAPYCADAVHETVQWLPDGNGGASNRIVRTQNTRLCRDGDGRTRQEVERGGRKLVYLRDPLARDSWLLDPERRTARRTGGGRDLAFEHGVDTDAVRDYAQRMKEWARGMADRARAGAGMATPPTPPTPPLPALPATAPTPPAPPMPVVITRPADGSTGRDVEVNVVRLRSNGPGAAGEMAPPVEWTLPPPAVQWRATTLAPRGGGSASPLGSKDIDGLRANGERTTWVIEAGRVGNDKPIQITRDVWTAPELMLTLLSRDFDPRNGEVNYRLKNVRRGEPDAALMRVPADFKQTGRN